MTTSSKTSIRVTSVADTLHSKDDIISSVNQALERYYLSAGKRAEELHPRYGKLFKAMQLLSIAGGKRIRPYLAVSTYEAYGGNQYEDIVTVGAALEMLHMALLIHDDIIDRDLVRHGVDNIAGQYQTIFRGSKDANHYAGGVAILAGDISLSAAYQLVLESGFSAGQKLAAQTLIAEAVFHVAGGELLDTDAPLHSMAETDPIDIAVMKTAQYSFVTPLLIGAVLAGVKESELAALTEFGMQVGVAFQLADDLLGIFGDEELTGKSALGDIREGKHTWLAQESFRRAKKNQLPILQQYYGYAKISQEDARKVREAISACGAKKACEKLIADYAAQALETSKQLNISHESRNALAVLVEDVTRRDR